MSKNTKAKVVKTEKHWFSERSHGKAEITAVRLAKDIAAIVEPDIKAKSKTRNIDAVEKVLRDNGRISIDEAVKKFLDIHPMRSTRPEIAAKTAFLQANSHGVSVKIEKIGDETFIELA